MYAAVGAAGDVGAVGRAVEGCLVAVLELF